MTALLSIKPEFAEAIFDGTKKFEFRKVKFKKNVNKIKVYATKPVGKIIGEFIVDNILEAGIDKERYLKYFNGKSTGFAIKIKSANKYKEAICPYLQYPNFVAPQSFMYIG